MPRFVLRGGSSGAHFVAATGVDVSSSEVLVNPSWHMSFNRGLLTYTKSGKVIVMEHFESSGRLRVAAQASTGTIELVSDAVQLLVRSKTQRQVALWSDCPLDWSTITATDMEVWKYENPLAEVKVPAPSDPASSWRGLIVPAYLVFGLWNAWLKSSRSPHT